MRLRALILLPFLVCCSLIAVEAQTSTTLQQGIPIERSLGPGQTHEFTVNAKENSFVQLVVEQKGIDVVVKISLPDGKSLSECDSPSGAEGLERVSFLATAEGKYRVAVSALETDEPQNGRYQIKLVEVREATEEEIERGKNREAARAKGVALLLELREAISQIKSPQTRINAQLTAANLLREYDEKGAAKYLSDAIADLKQFLASLESDTDEYMSQFSVISQLRSEMIQALAEHDPDEALNFLHATAPKYSPYAGQRELVSQESALELSIVDHLARKDPNRALQIAKQNLKKTYSPALLSTASQLADKNPELATELVHDMINKLMGEEKLINNVEAANLAMALANSYHAADKDGSVEVKTGNAVVMTQPGQLLRNGLLSEQEYKQLLQRMVREVLSFTLPPGGLYAYASSGGALWSVMAGLNSLGPELDKVVSGSTAALAKKQTELVGNVNQYVNQFQEFQNALANNPVDAVLETIEKAPAELRDQLYIQLATREANNGDMTRAKQIINDHIANPYQRGQALRSIEQQEIEHSVSSGKVEEALRNIATLRTPGERAEQLTQLAAQIGPGQKRATALSLLEQARGLLPPSPQAQDQEQMGALLEIARAFSNYDSKRSFEMIDPLIDQFNDLCTSARALQGFGFEVFDEDELAMDGENSLAQIAEQMSDVLGSLALINFDRAKAASDKIRLPEVRLHVYLQIAEQTIGGEQ